MKKHDLICYDFDGTLCNTLPDIVNSMNVVLEQNGFQKIVIRFQIIFRKKCYLFVKEV